MFSKISMTGSGIVLFFLSMGISMLGINAEDGQIQVWTDAIITVAGLVLMIWGQLRRGDLTMGILRKFHISSLGNTTIVK